MLRYRLWQFWQIVTAVPLEPSAIEEIATILSAQEMNLFAQFSLNDQWHSYRVMKMLRDDQHPLLVAALLHDVGKTQLPLSIWERSLIVLASIFLPGQTAVWGQGEAVGWKRPFVVKAQHPAWGGAMAAEAGSHPLAIKLIQQHQDTILTEDNSKEAELLRLLQWADDQN